MRLGVGHPGDRNRVVSHVLRPFAKADEEWLQALIASLAAHAALLVKGDDQAYMSKVALDVKPHQPKRELPKTADKQTDNPTADKPAAETPAKDKPGEA